MSDIHSTTKHSVLTSIRHAATVEDDGHLEEALNNAFRFGLFPELAPIYIELLGVFWHMRHEDIVSALQKLKEPSAVNALESAANDHHEYLRFDEDFGLARKCTWALADIGTAHAKDALFRLSEHPNPAIAGYAQKRIDQWDEETSRKGTQLCV